MKLIISKPSLYLLILLVAADLAFIALGIIYECGFIKLADFCISINFNSYFSITRDRGYAEVFQYIKEYWLIILFAFLAINHSIKVYSGWIFLFIYLLVDDALEIHEKAGLVTAEKLNYISFLNLRPEDYGELTVFAVVGLVFFLWLSFSYKIAEKKEKKIFKNLITLLCGLSVFAILLDIIHIILDDSVFWKSSLAIIEDGGEHIILSLIVCYVWSLVAVGNPHIDLTKNKIIPYNH